MLMITIMGMSSAANVCRDSPYVLRWDKALASLLNAVTKHLGKRLSFEQSPRDAQEQQELLGSRADGPAESATGGARQALDEATQRRVVGMVVRLAGRAQYSKVGAYCPCTCHTCMSRCVVTACICLR